MTFADVGEGPDYNPAIDVDNAVIATLQTPSLVIILDGSMRSFGDVGDTSDYDPFNDEAGIFSTFGFNAVLYENDYEPDDTNVIIDDFGDGGEYDVQDNNPLTSFIIYTELFVENDYTPSDTDELLDDTGEEQAWYPSLDDSGFLSFIIFTELFISNDYSPMELETLTEDLGEGDYYPDFSIDLAWYFAPQTLLIFNDYIPLEGETLN